MKREGKMSDKGILIILAILIVIVIIVIVAINVGKKGKENKDNENIAGNNEENVANGPAIEGSDNVSVNGDVKTNVSEAIKKEKKYGIYTISDISLESVAGNTTLTASVSADVTEKVAGKPVTIKFYDNAGNVVETMSAYIPQVKPGETSLLTAQSTTDLANAYDFEIVDAE